jgi:hypothetical protein
LDVINQQDVTDDNNLPPLWDPMSVDSVDYYENEITDLPPLLDDDDDDADDDIYTFDVIDESTHSRLSSTNVAVMDPPNVAIMDTPRDGNFQLQEIYDINDDLLPLPLIIHNNEKTQLLMLVLCMLLLLWKPYNKTVWILSKMEIIIFRKIYLHN